MRFGNETLYRLFVLVADEKSITKASEKLYISQPAVSKQIKKLENELNTVLFNRKNMELTKNGKKIYNELKPIFFKLERIEHSFETKRKIRLGTYNTLMSKLLSSSILEYYNIIEFIVEEVCFMFLFSLIYEFLKIGAFSFGGGFATLPYIFELSDKTNWFDYTEVNRMLTISQMTPRTIGM